MARNHPSSWRRRERGWKWTALVLGLAWCSFGCNPASLSFLLLPFVDDRRPADCPLAAKDKEVTVAIMSTFGTTQETRLEVAPAANELAEVFAQHLRKRSAANKEKIKIVPPGSVISYLNNRLDRRGVSNQEIGKHFKADYVISLEIADFTLFARGSQIYQGNAEIDVRAYAVNKDAGGALVFEKIYRLPFPDELRPMDTVGMNIPQFRALFVSKIAGDLTRHFTATPREVGVDRD